jgi:glycosyltransferase involved in cell wall biosynthesis
MAKKATRILKIVVLVFDYPLFILVSPLCLISLLVAIPWILKQRKVWNQSVNGNPKVLILRKFKVERLKTPGYQLLMPYRNQSLKWIGFLDAANSVRTEVRITDDLSLITFKSPKIVRFLAKTKFNATSMLLRELIAVFRITSYCVKQQIGVLRVYKHDYPALQACLVSKFIKIPFIVDIIGNFELIRRLTGRNFYFRDLNKLPFIRIFARMATNWLLGWPLKNAYRVFSRGIRSCEYAFELGAPVERLSLLRISNFSAAFNSYNPERPAAKPALYPYMLFVGRLDEIKFPLDVLIAFDLAASHLPEYHLVVIGDGTLRNEVEQIRERSEYKDRVVLLGACSTDIVLNWTAHATASICPYSGSTLVEAMLCGIPIIAYDVGWHPEVVIDDYTGYLTPFRNTSALAEKMIYVARNYEEAKAVGRRGRELARVVFDKKKISEKESMYYQQALSG